MRKRNTLKRTVHRFKCEDVLIMVRPEDPWPKPVTLVSEETGVSIELFLTKNSAKLIGTVFSGWFQKETATTKKKV